MRDRNDTQDNYISPNSLLGKCKITARLGTIGVLILAIFGCEDAKNSQCEQIFYLARDANENVQKLTEISSLNAAEQPQLKSWLTAAKTMNQAADKIVALKIEDANLIEQRQKLATVYRLYARATYDAVQAREAKNLEALQAARIEAEQAGEIQTKLIEEINTYCLNETKTKN